MRVEMEGDRWEGGEEGGRKRGKSQGRVDEPRRSDEERRERRKKKGRKEAEEWDSRRKHANQTDPIEQPPHHSQQRLRHPSQDSSCPTSSQSYHNFPSTAPSDPPCSTPQPEPYPYANRNSSPPVPY